MGWSLLLAYGVAARAGAIPDRKPRKRYEHGWPCERVQKCRDCKQQGCYEVKDRAATCSSERYIAAESPRCRRRLRLRRGSPPRSFPGSNPISWRKAPVYCPASTVSFNPIALVTATSVDRRGLPCADSARRSEEHTSEL